MTGPEQPPGVRPTPEQVLALAPDRAAAAAALTVADPASWSSAGCDEHGVWGHYLAPAAEPYEVAVDLRGPAYRCTCPSRKLPCKHELGLLLLLAHHHVPPANRLPFADRWLRGRDRAAAPDDEAAPPPEQPRTVPEPELEVAPEVDVAEAGRDGDASVTVGPAGAVGGVTEPGAGHDPAREQRRLDRAERMRAGLVELDRWAADRVRHGLAEPELTDPATWERLAARLVDAQCGGLANRVRRVATRVGAHAAWHEEVLEELAVLHALSRGARRTSMLPEDLADGVHVATGLTASRDDVLAGVPSTARWLVAGESRTREDRITVQRTWLCTLDGAASTWAMLLAFGTFGNEVASPFPIGSTIEADVHWYPGAVPLRALVGRVHGGPAAPTAAPRGATLLAAIAAAGAASAREPWLERYPVVVDATPVPLGDGRWAMSDPTGSVALVPGFRRTAELVAASGGRPVTIAAEWSVDGVAPLTTWSDGAVVPL